MRPSPTKRIVVSPPVSRIDLLGFDHVDLKVRNRTKARAFFVDQLGMDVIGEGPDHTYLAFGDQVLGLHDAAPGTRPDGVDHVALRVGAWTGLRSRVRRARIQVTREKERGDSRSLYLRGPDGLKVELVWRPDPEVHSCSHPAPALPPKNEGDDPGRDPGPSRRRR
jgi:metallothiol transferase